LCSVDVKVNFSFLLSKPSIHPSRWMALLGLSLVSS
jgi:hypothetical protein